MDLRRRGHREARLTKVVDAGIGPVASVEPHATLQEASAAMLDAGVQAAVVVDAGKPVGVLRAETIAAAMAAGLDVTAGRAEAAADRRPVVVSVDDALLAAHERMRRVGRDCAVVIDQDGRLVGLLGETGG